MSAFSNWNGPSDCCGSNMSAPQVASINQMIAAYSTLQAAFDALKIKFDEHAAETVLTADPHGAKTAVDSKQPAGTYADGTKTYVEVTPGNSQLSSGYQPAGVYATPGNITDAINGLSIPSITGLETDIINIGNRVTAIEAAAQTSGWNVVSGSVTETLYNIKCLTIQCRNIIATNFVDFVSPAQVSAKASIATNLVVDPATGYPVPGNTTNPTLSVQTCLVAELSDIWENPQIPNEEYRFKPATIYIKFVNTAPFSAVVHATHAFDTSTQKHTGALDVTLAKTDQHSFIHFGLYVNTDAAGQAHVYLGIAPRPASGTPAWDFTNTCYVSGINAKPYSGTAQGTCHFIAGMSAGESGKVTDKLIINELAINKITDKEGHTLIEVDHANDIINIGDPNDPDAHNVNINSEDRVTIRHADNTTQQVAYLSDLVQSTYWRKTVTVFATSIAALNSSAYTVDQIGGNVCPRGTPGSTTVPGIYLTNPAADNTRGIIFQAGVYDSALIMMNGDASVPLADGQLNWDTVTQGLSGIPIGTIQSFDIEFLKNGTNVASSQDGTLLIDSKGKNVKVVGHTTTTIDVILYTGPLPVYALPGYATFNGTTWIKDSNIGIAVPGTDLGYTRSISYQWSGHHQQPNHAAGAGIVVDPTFVPAFITWTPHYANQITTAYTTDFEEWSFTDWAVNMYNLELPVGSVINWPLGSVTVPVGFLPCDGSAQDQITYAELYAIIGNRFNGVTSPGAGMFRVPDMTGGIIRYAS